MAAPEPPAEQDFGQCGWCDNAATLQLIISPGRSRRKLAPVCRPCSERFAKDGVITTEREFDLKYGSSSR